MPSVAVPTARVAPRLQVLVPASPQLALPALSPSVSRSGSAGSAATGPSPIEPRSGTSSQPVVSAPAAKSRAREPSPPAASQSRPSRKRTKTVAFDLKDQERPRPCEQCYRDKVRCSFVASGKRPCAVCTRKGMECVPRTGVSQFLSSLVFLLTYIPHRRDDLWTFGLSGASYPEACHRGLPSSTNFYLLAAVG